MIATVTSGILRSRLDPVHDDGKLFDGATTPVVWKSRFQLVPTFQINPMIKLQSNKLINLTMFFSIKATNNSFVTKSKFLIKGFLNNLNIIQPVTIHFKNKT